ncbi:MAG: hypothetical protein EA355_01560 [Rhodobacteraceae bacterium]|nr:MAG: hypothetical protein EA355_01560 [Paracoccaceae bacterium]
MAPRRPSAACAALAVALLATGVARNAAAADPACVAAIDGGDAAFQRDGVWSPATPGPLDGVAAVRTGRDARVEIRCADGLVLTIGVMTEASVESLVASAAPTRNVVVRLFRGIVGLASPAVRRARTEIRTPLAIAAARSTAWLVETDPADGATAVFAREGRVAVSAPTDPAAGVVLGPGEGVDVTASDGVAPTARWGAPRLAEAGDALGFGWR